MFDILLKVLIDMREFLALINRCLMKCLWVRLPSLVHPKKLFVSSNVRVFAMKWGGGLKGFSRICSEVGVEPK